MHLIIYSVLHVRTKCGQAPFNELHCQTPIYALHGHTWPAHHILYVTPYLYKLITYMAIYVTHSDTIKGSLLWATWPATHIFHNCLVTHI